MFGKSRQAYYKRKKVEYYESALYKRVVALVQDIRLRMPRIGTRKLYFLLQAIFQEEGLKVGRDKLFHILKQEDMLIKPKKNYQKTTNSKHWLRKHKNLILDLKLEKAEQVWVSDITYIPTENGYEYLSLVTDAYSKQIMGYHLADDLSTKGVVKALKMALKNRKYQTNLIHHSDRGLQYCAADYQKILKKNNIKCSMTESYDPYQNAIAERVNGILKSEFNIDQGFLSHLDAVQRIKESIEIYNQERPHLTLKFKTPKSVHEKMPSKIN